MKRYLKIFILFLLLFNSIGAIYGGMNLLLYPDGSGLGMSLSMLQYSSFKNFFFPGLVLLAVNGLFGLIVCISLLKNSSQSTNLVIIQGVLLTGWIVTQVILLRLIFVLHPVMLAIGILLIISGWLLKQRRQVR